MAKGLRSSYNTSSRRIDDELNLCKPRGNPTFALSVALRRVEVWEDAGSSEAGGSSS